VIARSLANAEACVGETYNLLPIKYPRAA